MQVLTELSKAVQAGTLNETVALTHRAIEAGIDPREVLDKGLITAMEIVGQKFKRHEIFVPEMLIAARAMNKALSILEPKMIQNKIKTAGTILLGTVQGDLHDIGKNLVGILYKGAGFRVIDLGTDVAVERFIAAAREHKPDIIGLSALLTTTMGYMQLVIEGLRRHGIAAKVIVGGAPITEAFAGKINAHGYADDAATALDLGKKLLAISKTNT
jgi:5-methyltetrahydrofolate--homocysteine methyltransferase